AGPAREQLPLTVAHDWLAQHGQQPIVELVQPLIDRFLRTANQMGRDAFLAPLELSLVKEAQPWEEKRNDRRGFVHFRRERRSRSRLLAGFPQAGELVLLMW